MRLAQLSDAAGLPPATVKWYLRIGLVPRGEATARNQARYGPRHVHRLRLVRALLEIGGLSVADARRVLAALDDPACPLAAVVAVAHTALSGRPGGAAPRGRDSASDLVDDYLTTRGWAAVAAQGPRDRLADVLATMAALRQAEGGAAATPPASRAQEVAALLDPYADAADTLAAAEIAGLGGGLPREAAVERAVLGTVLMERAFTALRHLAQEHHMAAQVSSTSPGTARSVSVKPRSRKPASGLQGN